MKAVEIAGETEKRINRRMCELRARSTIFSTRWFGPETTGAPLGKEAARP